MSEPSAAQLQRHLHAANEIARRALAAGHHPFGAVLVAADHETVLLEQGNVDAVNHAEAVLARAAAARFTPQELWGCTLYTDVRLYCERGIPAVIYGAGPRTVFESNAKRADEHLVLEDLRRATKVVARTLYDLLAPR